MPLNNLMKTVGKTLHRNSPAILTGLAAAGVISTTILAVRVTPEVIRRIDWERDHRLRIDEDVRRRQREGEAVDLYVFVEPWEQPLEIVKIAWPLYIPAAISGVLTIGCIIGANQVSTRRQAALIGAYSLIESNYKEYREKIIEQIGSSKEQTYRDQIVQERVATNPPDSTAVSMIVSGNVLCFDTFSGRYFQSNMETLRKAMNDINNQCYHEMSASQNEFYNRIGLPSIESGEMVGWNMDNPLELQFSTVLSIDDKPCLAVGYHRSPVANFHKIW